MLATDRMISAPHHAFTMRIPLVMSIC
jgi:hypothetical protein